MNKKIIFILCTLTFFSLSFSSASYGDTFDGQFTVTNYNISVNVSHNSLAGLQGGSPGQYLHINQTIYDDFVTMLANYITITVNNLVNYYTKTETNSMLQGNFTSLISINTTKNIQELLNSTGIYYGMINHTLDTFNEYNSTWDNNGQIQMLSVNISSVNTTRTIGQLYNVTASMIANLSISQNYYNFSLATYNQWNDIWSTTYNSTYANYESNVSRNQTLQTFNQWNSTWDNNWFTQMLSANDTALNTSIKQALTFNSTYNIGVLYNVTSSMIANLSINQLNGSTSLIANTSFNQNVLTYNNSLFNSAPWNYSAGKIYPNNISAYVGIGTATPEAKLDIRGTAGTGVQTSVLKLVDTGGGVSNGAAINFTYSTGAIENAKIGALSVTGGGGALTFAVAASDGVSSTERMRITKAGNVGIGTTAPAGKLDIKSENNAYGIHFTASDGSSLGGFYENSAGHSTIYMKNSSADLTTVISASGYTYFNGGSVGIGTTNPGYKLDVNGSVQIGNRVTGGEGSFMRLAGKGGTSYDYDFTTQLGNYLQINSSNSASKPFVIDSTGNVGIGTTNPLTLLHLNLTQTIGDNATLRFDSNANVNNASDVIIASSINGFRNNFAKMQVQRGSSLGQGWNFIVSSNAGAISEAMRIAETGNVGIGTTNPDQKLSIKLGNVSFLDTSNNERLRIKNDPALLEVGLSTNNYNLAFDSSGATNNATIFKTGNGNIGTGTERMRITGVGNVGIGTTSPNSLLEIYSLTLPDTTLTISGRADVNRKVIGRLNFFNSYSLGLNSTAQIMAMRGINQFNSTQLGFFTSNSTGNINERMTIDESGNVGIGTTSPTHKLNVVGNGNFTGNLTFNTYYSGFYKHNDSGDTINFAVANATYNFTGICGETNGLACGGETGTINVSNGGMYRVNYVASGVGVNNHLYHISVYVNGVEMNRTASHMLASAGDVISMVGVGHLRLQQNDYLNLRIKDSSGTGTGTSYANNFIIERISN